MNKKNKLPLAEPVFSTYHNYGSGGAIIASNPSIKNWYINNSVMLMCGKRFLTGYSSPQLQVRNTSYNAVRGIEKHHMSLKLLNRYRSTLIKRMIDEGYYVVFQGFDDYYIEGKSWYKTRHFAHDGMIYGYDDEKKIYNMFAYDKDWIYKEFEVPQRSFWKAQKSGMELCEDCALVAVKPKQDIIEVDLHHILFLLELYMDPEAGKQWLDMNNYAYGIEVHDYLCLYLNKLEDGSIPYEKIDWRVFRVLWEHKRVMLERIKTVEQLIGTDDSLSTEYSEVVKIADDSRLMYATYVMRRRDPLLQVLKSRLLKIKKIEEEFIPKLIDTMAGSESK